MTEPRSLPQGSLRPCNSFQRRRKGSICHLGPTQGSVRISSLNNEHGQLPAPCAGLSGRGAGPGTRRVREQQGGRWECFQANAGAHPPADLGTRHAPAHAHAPGSAVRPAWAAHTCAGGHLRAPPCHLTLCRGRPPARESCCERSREQLGVLPPGGMALHKSEHNPSWSLRTGGWKQGVTPPTPGPAAGDPPSE